MPNAWDVLEKKVYDTLVALKTPENPDDEPEAELGNVWRFRPEDEHSGRLGPYFYADVSGERQVRAWCVFVEQALDLSSLGTISIRLRCSFTAWYAQGVGGAGIMLLKQHVSQVQGALKALGYDLDGATSIVPSWDFVSYRSEQNPVDRNEGKVVMAEWGIECLTGMVAA